MRRCGITPASWSAASSPPTSACCSPRWSRRTPDPNFLKTGLTFPYVGGVNYASGSGSVDQYRQKDDTYALFTNDTYHITDKLELNVGLRYTDDEKVLNTH